MKKVTNVLAGIVAIVGLLPGSGACFDSGSTGADGDFNPSVGTEVQLPPNGILNYRSVTIPAGVTVRFKRNATNTPVVILVQGDATIAGSMSLDGAPSPPTGSAGDGNLIDDGQPGKGGPGGFDGGYGGARERGRVGGDGLGPGGGRGGNVGNVVAFGYASPTAGGGGGFFSAGGSGGNVPQCTNCTAPGGSVYGTPSLTTLVGGSGGGGGASGERFHGSGGGGGGGALLLAATGTVDISGVISARGGASGDPAPEGDVAGGGAGSGGAVRIVATRLIGSGTIDVGAPASGGDAVIGSPWGGSRVLGGGGSPGRIRYEAEIYAASGIGTPGVGASVGLPSPLSPLGGPTLRFVSVGAFPVPDSPTGVGDVTIPAGTSNPVSIVLASARVPVGSVIRVVLVPQSGSSVGIDSPPTVGTTQSATTTVTLDVPAGRSTLQASVTYNLIAGLGDALSRFAESERVEKVTLTSTLGQPDQAMLHTVTGRQFPIEPALLALAALPY